MLKRLQWREWIQGVFWRYNQGHRVGLDLGGGEKRKKLWLMCPAVCMVFPARGKSLKG
jgi:hypothetical protein